MDEFYTDNFLADPMFAVDFESYMTEITSMMFNEAGNPHIFMTFDANYMFALGTPITVGQVLQKMQSADYQVFITDYLMRNPPVDQLDAVMGVEFRASVMQVQT